MQLRLKHADVVLEVMALSGLVAKNVLLLQGLNAVYLIKCCQSFDLGITVITLCFIAAMKILIFVLR